MADRRSFLKGLVAATIPLFIPSDRLDWGVPKRQLYVPPKRDILTNKDIKFYTKIHDNPEEVWGSPAGYPQGDWIEHGVFTQGGMVFYSTIEQYEYRIDQEIDPMLMSGPEIEEVYNKRAKKRVVLNPRRGV